MITWTAADKALLSVGFSRQEYWSGLPCPPPGDLPNPGTEPRSPALQEDSLLSEPPGKSLQNTNLVSGSLKLIFFFEENLSFFEILMTSMLISILSQSK